MRTWIPGRSRRSPSAMTRAGRSWPSPIDADRMSTRAAGTARDSRAPGLKYRECGVRDGLAPTDLVIALRAARDVEHVGAGAAVDDPAAEVGLDPVVAAVGLDAVVAVAGVE